MSTVYDSSKLERFNKYIIEEYNKSLFIEKIGDVSEVDSTDGTFTQIAIRPLIQKDMLVPSNYVPELMGVGRIIALGERDFLIKKLLEDNTIKCVRIKRQDFNPETLQNELESLNAKILLSVNAESILLKNRDWMKHLDFTVGNLRFNHFYDLFPIPDKILNNKLVILNELSLVWMKQVFKNEITKSNEKLEIEIGKLQNGNKVDVLIRSVNKFYYYKNYIKIIEII
ncbi:hypothetical protein HQ533_01275 [Candidatus Woesearchaeota archaeon]|nr:hypothetical protein [Candidatus Woesearchaeota archaeon]